MSKAILVMNMPEYCAQCPFMANESGKAYCRMGDDGDCHCSVTGFGKPYWCPLIPEPAYYGLEKWERDGYKGGWNDALDQIGLYNDALEGKQ